MELLVLKSAQVRHSGNAREPRDPGPQNPGRFSGRGLRLRTAAFRVLRRLAPRGRRSGVGWVRTTGAATCGADRAGRWGAGRAAPAAMGNLFGRKKQQSRVTEQDKAILVRRRALQAGGREPGTPGPGGETETRRLPAAFPLSPRASAPPAAQPHAGAAAPEPVWGGERWAPGGERVRVRLPASLSESGRCGCRRSQCGD